MVRKTAAAALVAATLFAAGTAHFESRAAAAGASTKAISLPSSLAGLEDQGSVMAAQAKAAHRSLGSEQANLTKVAGLTVAAYRKAYGGAAATYRAYSNHDLSELVSVIAVRAASPGLTYGPVPDPKYLGLAVDPNQVVDTGPVSCLVTQATAVAAGNPVKAANEVITRCQRSGPGLTVMTFGSLHGTKGRQTMVALTNAAWSAASKS